MERDNSANCLLTSFLNVASPVELALQNDRKRESDDAKGFFVLNILLFPPLIGRVRVGRLFENITPPNLPSDRGGIISYVYL